MSLLEWDNTKKERVIKMMSRLEFKTKRNSKEYKVIAICDNEVYVKEFDGRHLSGLYYLVSWKGYLEEEITWEPILAIQYLLRLVITFYKEYLKKLRMTSLSIDSILPMTKPTINLTIKTINKQKYGYLTKACEANKNVKKNLTFDIYLIFGFILITGKKFYLSHVIFHPVVQIFDSSTFQFLPNFCLFLLGIDQGVFSTTNQVFRFSSNNASEVCGFFINRSTRFSLTIFY